MSKSKKKEIVGITIKEMGLEDAMNTRIGGSGAEGISSGQKKRVSICIETLMRPKLLFLDEPTSGLDSAASYYVMSRIASLHKRDGIRRTIIASIHQPSCEVFQVFHDLCLLSLGRTIYFGPASIATEVRSLMFLMMSKKSPVSHTVPTCSIPDLPNTKKDLTESTDVVPAKDPPKIKSEESSNNVRKYEL